MRYVKALMVLALMGLTTCFLVNGTEAKGECLPDCEKVMSILKRGHKVGVVLNRLCPKSPMRVDITGANSVCVKCKGKKGEIGIFDATATRKRVVKYGCDAPQ